MGGKLFNGIKSMYVNSLASVRVKGGESEYFRIKSSVRRVYNVPIAFQCIYGYSDEGGGSRDGEGGLLYADDLVLSEEDLRAMVGCFAEVCRIRGLKVIAGKNKD